MITLLQLETFVELYYAETFIKASKKLFTTQSTVSKRIQELEKNLAVTLIDRKRNREGVELTHEGRILLKYAEIIINKKNICINEIAKRQQECVEIRIGCSETLIYLNLSKRIKKFNKIYPNINIKIKVANSERLKNLLFRGDIDFAFMMGPITEKDIITKHTYSCNMNFYSSIDLGNSFITLEKLTKGKSIITFGADTIPNKNLLALFDEFKITDVPIHNCSSLHSIIEFTKEDIGIGLIPNSIAQPYEEDNNIFKVNTVNISQMHFYSCYLRNSNKEKYLKFLTKWQPCFN